MLLEKLCHMKSKGISETKPGKDPPEGVGLRTLFYPISIMPKIFIEDSGNLKHPKNVKSINNTTVSYLISCHVIPRLATIKGKEKEVF